MAVPRRNHPRRRAGLMACGRAGRAGHVTGLSVATLYTARRAEPAIRDLDRVVRLDEAMPDDGDPMPAGAGGTVVYVAPGMQTRIVELAEADGARVTIPATAAIPADRHLG
ncbi:MULTISPECIES: hypothetical protein [unclassified Methylobacterium]|uniref:hypothetical protein n=1 Tax=unclassified Methylobacterium TaxID=2615210 RepID=UPI001650775D|nr:hypothetical protein [Methylobacterium sp. WL64]